MERLSKYTYENISKLFNGKIIHMKSDCEFFPNFDVTGRIIKYDIVNTELILTMKTINQNKIIKIGSNMKNLTFEILNK